MDVIAPIAAFAVLGWLVVRAIRRRAAMTPEQRAIQDLQREQRELRREQRRLRH